MQNKKDATACGKRVTVLFNPQDWEFIQAELEQRTADRGYPVTVSDVLRELVRESWGSAQ